MTLSSKRRYKNSLAQLLDYLENERASRHPPVHKKSKKEKVTIYRHHSLEKVAWVIYLRLGSLTDDAQVMHTLHEIRKFTGIALSTIDKMVFRWRRAGRDITNMKPKSHLITSGSSQRNKKLGLPLRKHSKR